MLLELLTLMGVAWVGSVFWIVSPELLSAVYGSQQGWHPLAVGLACATSQCSVYFLLYRGGDVLAQRWRFLARQIEGVRTRFGERLETSCVGMLLIGGITGLPPVIALVALSPGFGVSVRTMLATTFIARTARFATLAALGEAVLPVLQGW
jgi:membrane protein YqaA with SNARE-associated domain